MKLLFRIARQGPSTLRQSVYFYPRGFSTNNKSGRSRRTGLRIASAALATTAVGYGLFRYRGSKNDAPLALLDETRLPNVKYATLEQMKKVTNLFPPRHIATRLKTEPLTQNHRPLTRFAKSCAIQRM